MIYASNESKTVLARDLDDCRDNESKPVQLHSQIKISYRTSDSITAYVPFS